MMRGTRLPAAVDFIVESCVSCGCLFAITSDFREQRRSDKESLYCPNGHAGRFTGKTDAERAQEARAEADALREQLEHERRSNITLRGHVTRLKNERPL